MTSSGIDASVGIAAESTYGTYTAPTRWHEFREESLSLEIDRIDSQAIRRGRRVLHRWAPGGQRVSGDITIELAPQGIGLLLLHTFGAVTTTGTGPYTHTFTPGNLDDKSLTVQVGRPDLGGVTRAFSYLGCVVTSWTLSAEVGELVTFTPSFYGAHESTSDTYATPTYASGWSPFVFTHGSLTIGGNATDVKSVSIEGDNGLEVDRHRISATTPSRPKRPFESDLRSYSGELELDFTSLTDYNRFVNGTEAALNLTFNAGASAQLTVAANVRFDGETPTVGGHELLSLTLPFVCVSGTSDAAALTVTLVNSDSTP